MGLFDSKSKVSTSYDTTTNTEQTDNSGNSGFLGIGGGVSLSSQEDNSIQYSDSSSRSEATNISDSGNTYNMLSDSGAVQGAFGVANLSLNGAFEQNSNSLRVLSGLVTGALDNSVTLARDSINANKAATDQVISGFGSLAQQNASTSDDRVSKVALYAFAALAAIFVLPALLRGKAA
jgi:hypothetical protein